MTCHFRAIEAKRNLYVPNVPEKKNRKTSRKPVRIQLLSDLIRGLSHLHTYLCR